jgi:hypothetical protein
MPIKAMGNVNHVQHAINGRPGRAHEADGY